MKGEEVLTRIAEARKRAKFPADADGHEEREKTRILADLADEVGALQDNTLEALEKLAESSATRSARVTQLEARVKTLEKQTVDPEKGVFMTGFRAGLRERTP